MQTQGDEIMGVGEKNEIRHRLLSNREHRYVGMIHEGLTLVRDVKLGPKGPYDIWYHVTRDDIPAYSQRFKLASDFFGGMAKVRDDIGYFYIFTDGREVFADRFHPYDLDGLSTALQEAKEKFSEADYNAHVVAS